MLTTLPAELRIAILEMSIGEHEFHVSVPVDRAHTYPKTAIAHAQCYCCDYSRQRHLSALTATCRLLFSEANEILYRQTTMIFGSTEAIDAFFEDRIPALQHIRCVSLNCGPAKHLSPASKSDKRRVIRLLQQHARSLIEVRLCFNSYHGIHYDQQLMSNFWLHNISRLRGLKHFSLDINLDTLGPIGDANVSNAMRARTQSRIEQIESTVRSRVCEPKIQQEHRCGQARRSHRGGLVHSFHKVRTLTPTPIPSISEMKEQLPSDEESRYVA